ncbi:hypothetical protein POTOM_045510 [Populus tomentosa]|uniref:Uncharacterized protein n=1 Tax=Populus tomentosa TaxID=118781 RepID=A0A8X7YM28_POPTO|nr:hypothetical protein POTOM_045510 [Populus tomentosa]
MNALGKRSDVRDGLALHALTFQALFYWQAEFCWSWYKGIHINGFLDRILARYSIFNGKAALSIEPVLPNFSKFGGSERKYNYEKRQGCLGSLDTAEKSTGSRGKKKGPAHLRVFNLENTSLVLVTDLVSILERLLKVKAKRNVMKLPRNEDVPYTHTNISYA